MTAGDGGNPRDSLSIRVLGTVQGVGFRPFVYSLATAMGLRGYVSNTSEGVRIEVEGEGVSEFLERLEAEAPPLARISEVISEPVTPQDYEIFQINESADGDSFTLVSPDVATCEDCLRELADPEDRRHGYPFINCTNCGPRYSITERVPYDRPNTTMRAFTMCPECQGEYEDPSNRRMHAVPNACARCGPGLRLTGSDGEPVKCDDPVAEAASIIGKGGIVALKGLGGFHLACDAENPGAVRVLRERKRRSKKPFALMCATLDQMRRHCYMSEAEERALTSVQRPVVLLEKRPGCGLPGELAPGNRYLGFMLPYTPLHELLLGAFSGASPGAVMVMTSGNMSEEPIEVENSSARQKLSEVADVFLVHDRDIFMRVDDSVVMAHSTAEGDTLGFIRRSRGWVPEPLKLMEDGPDILAVGADLKNTFTVAKGPYAIVSQHIGDMEVLQSILFFEETLDNLSSVYRVKPVALAHDLHPGYASTRWAIENAGDAMLYPVQHHHAHIASVMAEHGLGTKGGKVIGVALDGTGYGPDGTLWGGEFLVAGLDGFERAGHFSYIALPGGEKAIREPWRTAVSLVCSSYGAEEAMPVLGQLGFFDSYGEDKVRAVAGLVGMREFSPLSSGAGRFFDAASALLGLRGYNTFEGEAAIALEAVCDEDEAGDYPVDVVFRSPMEVDFT
ncbi:MAG: carbamoyltransferase HypF, partial [Thermodesulfovibrionales bacterium]|nr:carbamoyltransferase HypF [Thermodesulfovibrionales bacterium]